MTKLTRFDAKEIARNRGIPLDRDYHALPAGVVEQIVAAADEHGYRQPKNANGSRARYFHAYLIRAATRGE